MHLHLMAFGLFACGSAPPGKVTQARVSESGILRPYNLEDPSDRQLFELICRDQSGGSPACAPDQLSVAPLEVVRETLQAPKNAELQHTVVMADPEAPNPWSAVPPVRKGLIPLVIAKATWKVNDATTRTCNLAWDPATSAVHKDLAECSDFNAY